MESLLKSLQDALDGFSDLLDRADLESLFEAKGEVATETLLDLLTTATNWEEHTDGMPPDALNAHLWGLEKECRHALDRLPHDDFPNSEELAGAIIEIIDAIFWVLGHPEHEAALALQVAIQGVVTELETDTTAAALQRALDAVAMAGRKAVEVLGGAKKPVSALAFAPLSHAETLHALRVVDG